MYGFHGLNIDLEYPSILADFHLTFVTIYDHLELDCGGAGSYRE